MNDLIQSLSSETGSSPDMIRNALGAIFTFLKSHLDPGLVGARSSPTSPAPPTCRAPTRPRRPRGRNRACSALSRRPSARSSGAAPRGARPDHAPLEDRPEPGDHHDHPAQDHRLPRGTPAARAVRPDQVASPSAGRRAVGVRLRLDPRQKENPPPLRGEGTVSGRRPCARASHRLGQRRLGVVGLDLAVPCTVEEVDHQADRHPDDQPDPGVARQAVTIRQTEEITPSGAVNQTTGVLNGRSTSGCVIRRTSTPGADDGEGEQGADRGQLARRR